MEEMPDDLPDSIKTALLAFNTELAALERLTLMLGAIQLAETVDPESLLGELDRDAAGLERECNDDASRARLAFLLRKLIKRTRDLMAANRLN